MVDNWLTTSQLCKTVEYFQTGDWFLMKSITRFLVKTKKKVAAC